MAPWIKANVDEKDFQILDRLGITYSPLEENLEQIAEVNTNDWIVMPKEFSGLKHNLSISPARVEYSSAVEKVGKSLDLNLKNTSKDSLGREFVGNINRDNALKLNILMGNETMSPREGIDFLHLLYKGMQGKIDVYTEAGKKLDQKYLQNIFEDVVKVQSPWRAEWLDADYEKNENGLYLRTKHDLNIGSLTPTYRKLLTSNTLMEGKGVSLDSLFEKRTAQGHASTKTKEGNFNYWHPREDNNSGAGFVANVDYAFLDCVRFPSVAFSGLGVRAAKQGE